MPILTLKVSKELFTNLEYCAALKGESKDAFALKALQDSLNMWEDFTEMEEDETAVDGCEEPPCFQS